MGEGQRSISAFPHSYGQKTAPCFSSPTPLHPLPFIYSPTFQFLSHAISNQFDSIATTSSSASLIYSRSFFLSPLQKRLQITDICHPRFKQMDTKNGSADACKPASNDAGAHPATRVSSDATLGDHIARRLVEIGISDIFTVPGDFNLTLLDHLIAEPRLTNVGCCNELNAGYARCRGVAACVVTFTVGGLSVLNAIAGAYSENLPVICIVGGPNSNDYGTNRILHHTIGVPDFTQELRCFQTVTCFQAVVNNLDDAHELIDTAISTALKESKPVYISISCNLPGIPHPTFSREPVPFSLAPRY